MNQANIKDKPQRLASGGMWIKSKANIKRAVLLALLL